MQQSKSTDKQNTVSREINVFETRRLDAVRRNFAVGLKKEDEPETLNADALRLNDQANAN